MDQEKLPRLSRLTAILLQLQSRRLVTATELGDRFQISTRTVYRDIRALEEAGVPIITEEGKGYSLLDGYSMPPVMFTEREANALVTVEELLAKNKDASLVQSYREAILKIKAVLRYSAKDKVELLSKRLQFRQNALSEEEVSTSNYLIELQLALTNFCLVELHYCSLGKEENSVRKVEPFAMYHTQENWILIAWCRLREEFRAFRLDRITSLRRLEDTFPAHQMTLQDYFEVCRKKREEEIN